MTTVVRHRGSPFADLLSWFEAGTAPRFYDPDAPSYIRIEDYVEDGNYVLRAEMPGIDPEKDVAITIESDMLTIRGERREETKDREHHEFHYGSFARTVALPTGCQADAVSASYRDGVLEVRVPVDESAPEPRRIPVQRAGS